jgi:hypothetical protein
MRCDDSSSSVASVWATTTKKINGKTIKAEYEEISAQTDVPCPSNSLPY